MLPYFLLLESTVLMFVSHAFAIDEFRMNWVCSSLSTWLWRHSINSLMALWVYSSITFLSASLSLSASNPFSSIFFICVTNFQCELDVSRDLHLNLFKPLFFWTVFSFWFDIFPPRLVLCFWLVPDYVQLGEGPHDSWRDHCQRRNCWDKSHSHSCSRSPVRQGREVRLGKHPFATCVWSAASTWMFTTLPPRAFFWMPFTMCVCLLRHRSCVK